MIYDDGTESVVDEMGNQYAYDAAGNFSSMVDRSNKIYYNETAAQYAADDYEAAKLSKFYPEAGVPWWAQLATYGVTRAVDAHIGSRMPDKSAQPATFAGQNGKTYATGKATPATASDTMMIVVLAAAAFFALS